MANDSTQLLVPGTAFRMLTAPYAASGTPLPADALAYGHIHSPYQRQVGPRLLLSVGAVAGSNDTDPRPSYTVLDLDSEVWAEVRRVECPAEERLAAYEGAGFEVSEKSRRQLLRGGDWPVRAAAGRHRLR